MKPIVIAADVILGSFLVLAIILGGLCWLLIQAINIRDSSDAFAEPAPHADRDDHLWPIA